MIAHLLNSCLIGILFADFFERKHPNEYRFIVTDIIYRVLYFYSKAQIHISKLYTKCNHFIKSNQILSKIKSELDTIMKLDKEIILTEFIKNGEQISDKESSVCDFALLSWIGANNKCINKKIMYDLNEQTNTVECSDIKFMLVELCFREKLYKVILKTDNYNFYLVGNKFTRQFFIYYLKKYLLDINIIINDNDKIEVKIIDQDVNTIEIDFTDKNKSIVLEKNGYIML